MLQRLFEAAFLSKCMSYTELTSIVELRIETGKQIMTWSLIGVLASLAYWGHNKRIEGSMPVSLQCSLSWQLANISSVPKLGLYETVYTSGNSVRLPKLWQEWKENTSNPIPYQMKEDGIQQTLALSSFVISSLALFKAVHHQKKVDILCSSPPFTWNCAFALPG